MLTVRREDDDINARLGGDKTSNITTATTNPTTNIKHPTTTGTQDDTVQQQHPKPHNRPSDSAIGIQEAPQQHQPLLPRHGSDLEEDDDEEETPDLEEGEQEVLDQILADLEEFESSRREAAKVAEEGGGAFLLMDL
eukprot:TRINITY_DN9477_c0_g1_i1.p2 TRINITY_DN9477_c0_g1~~TRINITY_DN9477_c0_g1_i1.p2  ORF type:complete len:137 (+),score=34.18 TRINITY_DN9477_c0_g1_i1:728-1138(+)